MSAIPWVGVDIVELTNITNFYLHYEVYNSLEENISYLNCLPVIGTIHKNAVKKYKFNSNNDEYMNIPKSFISFFVGLVDGDGYIQITKTTKGFITIKLVISLHINDLSTLEYIHSVFKIGIVSTTKDRLKPRCKYIINRTDLQSIIFPLMNYHSIFFLTDTRANQFNKAIHILKNDIKEYDKVLLKDISDVYLQPKSPRDYINLCFFKDWIVGFVVSEGSFLVKSNNDACFQIKQRTHLNLFEAFKIIFETDRKLFVEKGLKHDYIQFSVSSKKDIEKVTHFFSHSELHPLVGLKNIQYMKWLEYLRNSDRYRNINYGN